MLSLSHPIVLSLPLSREDLTPQQKKKIIQNGSSLLRSIPTGGAFPVDIFYYFITLKLIVLSLAQICIISDAATIAGEETTSIGAAGETPRLQQTEGFHYIFIPDNWGSTGYKVTGNLYMCGLVYKTKRAYVYIDVSIIFTGNLYIKCWNAT